MSIVVALSCLYSHNTRCTERDSKLRGGRGFKYIDKAVQGSESVPIAMKDCMDLAYTASAVFVTIQVRSTGSLPLVIKF